MKRILTGLKPTGNLTLGNYIGAIKQMIDMQNEYDSILFVADLHALTIPQDPIELKNRIRNFIAMYIACGIDPQKNTINFPYKKIRDLTIFNSDTKILKR